MKFTIKNLDAWSEARELLRPAGGLYDALVAFQRSRGLKVTGKPDAETLAELRRIGK